MNPKEEKYHIKLTGEGVAVDKKVDERIAQSILMLLVSPKATSSNESVQLGSGTSGELTPKAFMIEKKPITDVEKITCLAYYATRYRKISEFKTEDLTELNHEAQQIRFSNPSVASRNAVRSGYLSLAGGAKKQITTRGEAIVEALPDRDNLRKVLEEHPYRPRRSKKSASSKRGR